MILAGTVVAAGTVVVVAAGGSLFLRRTTLILLLLLLQWLNHGGKGIKEHLMLPQQFQRQWFQRR